MKRAAPLALAVTLVPFLACSKDLDEGLLSFKVEREVPKQTIEGQTTPCEVTKALDAPLLDMGKIKVSKEKDFPNQDTKLGEIKTATLTELKLSLTGNSNATNWDFLDSVTVHANAKGQNKVKIAQIDPVPDGKQTLNFNETDENLAAYIKTEDGFSVSTVAEGCPPQEDAEFDGELVITIKANPL